MNNLIEENFIKTFVEKHMQDRFIFELTNKNPEKRQIAIQRFSNYQAKYFKEQYIHLANKNITIDDVEKEIRKLTKKIDNCYVIGWLNEDGKNMSLRQALEISFDWLGISIIIINDKVAFIKTETSIGVPMKFILYKKD